MSDELTHQKESDASYHATTGLIVFLPILVYAVFGASMYQWLEGFSIVDSYYFVVVTLATIGYGDVVPKTDAGKIFTIFFVIFGLAQFSTLISTIVSRTRARLVKRRAERMKRKEVSAA